MAKDATVARIDHHTAGAAAATLARAFADDPVFVWMAGGRALPPSKAIGGFRAVIDGELRKPQPELFMVENGGSVAIWHGIDEWKGSIAESIRLLPAFARIFGFGVGRVLRTISIMEKVHPTAPHYHLAYVGTDPSQQRRGLGTAILESMLERCDNEGVPAYLENSKPRNEAFYHRHGFVATGSLPLPKGAPAVTTMWREPRSK